MKTLKLLVVNSLTLSRVLLLGILVWWIPHQPEYLGQTLLFAVMGITDFLDGRLARRWKVSTEFGKAFDGIADKSIIAILVPVLWKYRSFPYWGVVVLGVLLFLLVWQTILYRKEFGRMPTPRRLGKMTFASWIFTMFPFIDGLPEIGQVALAVWTVFGIAAFFDYKKAYQWRWS